jgi:type I restriction enzyme R subunit
VIFSRRSIAVPPRLFSYVRQKITERARHPHHAIGDGMQQALKYGEMLQVPFIFSSNGDGFLEHDRTTVSGDIERELAMSQFPSPDELWRRYCVWKGIDDPALPIVTQDYYSDGSNKTPRYHQINAICNRLT